MVDRIVLVLPPSLRDSAGGNAGVFLLAVGILFVLFWWRIVLGQQYLVGGDVLYDVLPWAADGRVHQASNGLVGDTVFQMLPWQELVRNAFLHGHLPVWDQFSYSGTPLLANYQSAAFSVFTWIALPLTAPYGLSVAMLAKLCVAGVGMALFVRGMGRHTLSASVAGVAYAGCSYMTVWLGWPNSSVAALAPWTFALAEQYMTGGRIRSLAGFALAMALEVLAGHPETCAHMTVALAIYVIIRCAGLRQYGLRVLLALVLSGLLGAMVAAVQVIPFFEWLQHVHGVANRSALGSQDLQPQTLLSWLVPNGRGNPGIDHNTLAGLPPDYNESTGFVGVGTLILAVIGVFGPGSAGRARVLGLSAIALFGAGVVYGPLTPLFGRLPVFNASANWRMISVICLALCALGGLGLDSLLQRTGTDGGRLIALSIGLGSLSLLGLGVAEIKLLSVGAQVDTLLPYGPDRYIGFWLGVAALSAIAGLSFAFAALWGGRSRAPVVGFCVLVVIEVLLFAVPYNPRESPADVPPANSALTWLQQHAGGREITATGSVAPSESATLYGLHDVRGYQAGLVDPRQIQYWAHADPGFSLASSRDVLLVRPRARWLAMAGVAYIMTPQAQHIAGTRSVYSGSGVNIAAVPGARPFAFVATDVVPVRGVSRALQVMDTLPPGAVAVEGGCCRAVGDRSARVVVRSRQAQEVQLDVTSRRPATLVVLQSVSPGWSAQVDGNSVPIQPANVLFQSVRIPGGRHTVTLRYGTPGLGLGAVLSGIGLLGIIVMACMPEMRRRWTSRPVSPVDDRTEH